MKNYHHHEIGGNITVSTNKTVNSIHKGLLNIRDFRKIRLSCGNIRHYSENLGFKIAANQRKYNDISNLLPSIDSSGTSFVFDLFAFYKNKNVKIIQKYDSQNNSKQIV